MSAEALRGPVDEPKGGVDGPEDEDDGPKRSEMRSADER